jgi:hypothetical protein
MSQRINTTRKQSILDESSKLIAPLLEGFESPPKTKETMIVAGVYELVSFL